MRQIIILSLALLGSGYIASLVAPTQANQPDPGALSTEAEQAAASSLVGEFRSSVSGYLWMKADEYIHGGAGIRQLTEGEKKRNDTRLATTAHEDHDDHDDHEHDKFEHKSETSVVPHESNDQRFVWGDLERNLKPYFDPKDHKHKNQVETAPLYRFMTWADPKFVSAYSVGSYVLFVADRKNLDRPIAFLVEGVSNNPNSYILRADLASYLMRAKKWTEADQLLTVALDLLSNHPPKTEAETSGVQDCYRWAILLAREQADTSRERRLALSCLTLFPDDPVARRTLDPTIGK